MHCMLPFGFFAPPSGAGFWFQANRGPRSRGKQQLRSFLAARAVEQRRILGVLFSSTVFPGRAPDGHVTLTIFVGGTRRPELAALDPNRLVTLVLEELADLRGARGDPTFQQVVRWPRAIPQYVVGYGRWLDLMDHIEAANPGLFLSGSYRGGVALGDALRGGLNVAARVAGTA